MKDTRRPPLHLRKQRNFLGTFKKKWLGRSSILNTSRSFLPRTK